MHWKFVNLFLLGSQLKNTHVDAAAKVLQLIKILLYDHIYLQSLLETSLSSGVEGFDWIRLGLKALQTTAECRVGVLVEAEWEFTVFHWARWSCVLGQGWGRGLNSCIYTLIPSQAQAWTDGFCFSWQICDRATKGPCFDMKPNG